MIPSPPIPEPEIEQEPEFPQLPPPSPLDRLVRLFSGQGARQGYVAAVDQGLISLANFLATLILARSASPTELGVYGVGFTSLRLVRSIQEGLTIQPLNTLGASMDEEAFRSYATSTTLIQVLLALLSAGAAALGGWLLTAWGNDTAGPALFSLWSAFLWWQLQEYLRRVLYTRSRILAAAFNTALANLVRLALMVWLARQGQLDGSAGLHAIALGSLAALLVGAWQTRPYWSRQMASLRHTWQRNWSFGRWILGGVVMNWVSVEFYPVLTAGMISFAAAGAYRALQNLVAPIHLLLRATDTFLTPRAARLYHEHGLPALARTLRLTYWVAGAPVMGMLVLAILFPRPLLHLLYGDTYLEYSRGVVLMALFYLLWFAYWPLQTALKATRLSRPIFIGNLAAILAMFTAGLWMIQRWGVYGTIGGQALNALIVSVILWSAWSVAVARRKV
ncbi:MAG: hypothetical protein AB1894_10400 [Chloroflexota bacterium]